MTSGKETGSAPPWRWLAGLTLAVLALHLVLLQARPGAFSIGVPATTRALTTRSVPLAATSQPEPAPSTPTAQPTPNVNPVAGQPRARANADNTSPTEMPAETLAHKPEGGATPEAATSTVAASDQPPSTTPERGTATVADASTSVTAQPLATAFTLPGSVRMRYSVQGESQRRPYKADAALDWRTDGAQYEAALELGNLLGTRRMGSVGRITPEGLAPTRFSDKARSEQATHFDWAKGKIVFSSNAPEVPLQGGAQDRLSVLLQLGALIAGEPPRFVDGTTLLIQTAGTRDADAWLFTVGGLENLDLPGGAVKALKVQRDPRREFDQKIELWLAPGMEYLPVRLRLTQPNGDAVDLQWLATDRV